MARKILLADDSVTAQNMGRKILADAGYEIIAVNNGSAALKKIAELKPDLVILDVYMPGYSGLEVCQRLKESPDTARIPVLLTVGKLEPFKPEEAQRVRAEGYIVKPFEASELLSALSKLEDKVVPRAEPSKPGRFARAMAAAEETGRGSRGEKSGSDNGWKSRISFPHQKTESEEKIEDEASTYNPINRDLRTVVETPAERAEDEKRQHDVEATLDVTTLAPPGLPKDVTPEEVAAMTAAAAQMQMASGGIGDESRAYEALRPVNVESSSDKIEHEPAISKAYDDAATATDISKPAPAVAYYRRKDDVKPEEAEPTADVPVTIAATAESVVGESKPTSRWTAVPVELEGDEATLSLDQEMRKAHGGLEPVTVALPTMSETPSESSPVIAQPSVRVAGSEIADSVAEAPASAISNAALQTAPTVETSDQDVLTNAAVVQTEPLPVAQSDATPVASSFSDGETAAQRESVDQHEVEAPVVAIAEGAFSETATQLTAPAEFAGPNPTSADAFESPALPTEVASEGADHALDHPAAISEPAEVAEATMGENSSDVAPSAEAEAEPKADNETVKNTAAAWASWRQIRDTSKGEEVAQGSSQEFDAPQPVQEDTAALAVAAGAEQASQSGENAEPSRNPEDVASIVDSVLAGLRPKLMEEISRKMAEKK